MTFAPMIQKSDDYEQVESYIAKPYFLQQVMNGKHRWWAFTKVINRNDQAYKEISHIAWNIFIPDAEFDDRLIENEFVQKVDIITYEFENIPFETLNEMNKMKKVKHQF